jgi:hypothetical protein
MKKYKPIKYEFPYDIREGVTKFGCKSYAFYPKDDASNYKYLYVEEWETVYVNVGFARLIAANVESLKEVEEIIYNYDKNENV